MQTAAQPLAAARPINPKPQHGLSFTSSGRSVAPPTPRRRGGRRRTASKVISCSSIRIVDAKGEAVVTIDPPEVASRKVLHKEKEKTREKNVTMKATVTVHLKEKGSPLDALESMFNRKWLFVELFSSEVDPETQQERDPVSSIAELRRTEGSESFIYEARFSVPASFGAVGAVHVENRHHREMFIEDIKVSRDGDRSGDDVVCFHCNSWVVSKNLNPEDKRIFFPLKSYLPSQTPKGLGRLRKSELEALRGNGTGERRKSDRIYDYDVYNDLGDPDHDLDKWRPVLGGAKHPYPRRCRTGRRRTTISETSEERAPTNGENYVPRDEAFSEHKKQAFTTKFILSGVHAFLNGAQAMSKQHEESFPSLAAIDALYEEGFQNMPPPREGGSPMSFGFSFLKKEVSNLIKGQFGAFKDEIDKIMEFETPEIRQKDKLAWFRDEEFARETLAGMNPMSIQLVTELPIVSQLSEITYGPQESLITKELIAKQINGVMTADEAVEKKRLFMLDYHDLLLPYVHQVRALNKNPKDDDPNKEEHICKTTLYGSRTLFFLTDAGTLKPIAIELTRPNNNQTGQQYWREVFTPGTDGVTGSWLWQLAKTHVLAHDTGYHQLISHWLRTHCCVEPYIIAANRQLSQMHPIYRLLDPHFRYTMEINARARQLLINAEGIIEKNFSPKKYCMEISSAVYDKFWRFDMEALPNDLIRRGMAVQGEDGKLKLTIEDYPYANDGLLVWDAIKEWASDYVRHYYQTAADIVDDEELQAWWTEVRTKGHEDKKDEPWWPTLDSHENLVQVLATIMWVTSAHHAAVNFGQYPFGGYFPNRPTIARINMPSEKQGGTRDRFVVTMADLVKDPEKVLLDTLPSQSQSLSVMTILNLLSSHSPDEEYMGTHMEPAWTADREIYSAFQKFKTRMLNIREQIEGWNQDSTRKNRYGPGVVPYTLLMPCDGDPFDDERSIMEMGIPNSISI